MTYRLPPESPISEKQREDEGIRGVMWGLHVPQNLRKLTVANDEYAIKIDETYGGVGLRELDGDLAYVGHLINDGACLSNFGSAREYLKASKAAGNAGFRCYLAATRSRSRPGRFQRARKCWSRTGLITGVTSGSGAWRASAGYFRASFEL